MSFTKSKKCFIVAEVSANHGRSFETARLLIEKAKECGADAVKFQCYTPDTLTIDCDNDYFCVKHPKWGGQTLYKLYQRAYTPWRWFKKLKRVAEDLGLVFFATAFDKTSVDFLEELNIQFHKIASFELVDLPLIRYAAETKKSLIVSTGMATLKEIKEAVNIARKAGAGEIVLLKCVSSYPAKPREMNLLTIPDLKKRTGCPVGLSDHTLGDQTAIAAVSLGAVMVEKHFTLSRKLKGPDSFFSMEPREFKKLVEDIRIAEEALGGVRYGLSESEEKNRIFRRSLFVVKDVKGGERLTSANIRSIRPGFGISPKFYNAVLGKKAKRDLRKGTPLTSDVIGTGDLK